MKNQLPGINLFSLSVFLFLATFIFSCSTAPEATQVDGLEDEVEIIVDTWGISHIYANTEKDLFFAQGYNAARDRLFQLEIWRRQATGTVAEILGPKELKRDIGTRLFKYRGEMKTELNHYHPKGEMIINSYVDGINAYIAQTKEDPNILPPEFDILNIEPGFWTPEVVISRHQGLLGNIGQELNYGRAVAAVGEDIVKELSNFKPSDPDISLDPSITSEMLSKDILGLYNAYRRKVDFSVDSRVAYAEPIGNSDDEKIEYIGSNNWIIDETISESGFPIMANDPHRTQAIPSLRYWAHLVGPGWDVIGGGEPEIPGISIGHNGQGAWGLTVFRTDGEDLYVYDLNPENLNEYKYKDGWENMKVITEAIPVKDQEDEMVELRYTRHGPITFIDSALNKAYAVRCAWAEPGGSPYLASLRMDQAQTWEEFREACNYSNIPGENMIWADKDGNIGWQAVGIAPLRRNWSGLVPIPGDGRYEWDGYLPIIEKPNVTNPDNGLFGTANEYVVPDDYTEMDAIGFVWSDSYRGDLIREVLGSGKKMNLQDMVDLQTSYFSSPARILVPYLSDLEFTNNTTVESKMILGDWDFELSAESVAAGIYVQWERTIQSSLPDVIIPEDAKPYISFLPMEKIIYEIQNPGTHFGENPIEGRNDFLMQTFTEAVTFMEENFGIETSKWVYGQDQYKHIEIKHPLDPILNEEQKALFNTELRPRGGNSYTLNNTSFRNNQSSGPSFRIIVDTGDFDKTLGTNSPGQSGDPRDKHYKDLYDMWANNEYFPVYYSRDKVEENVDYRILLKKAD